MLAETVDPQVVVAIKPEGGIPLGGNMKWEKRGNINLQQTPNPDAQFPSAAPPLEVHSVLMENKDKSIFNQFQPRQTSSKGCRRRRSGACQIWKLNDGEE